MAEFGGLPIVIDEHMPADELWLVQYGHKRTLRVHEGPQAGQGVEIWLQKPRIVRIVNLGEIFKMPTPKIYFDMPEVKEFPEVK